MSTILEAFGTLTTFTTSANANLVSSATAGWKSAKVDNHTDLYDDALVLFDFAEVNTAPSAAKAIFVFAFGSFDGTLFNGTGAAAYDGTEGTLTYPDITTGLPACPRLGIIPYSTINVQLTSQPFSVARCFGGILPPYWGIGMVNYSSMTLNVNSIKWIGLKYTVA